MGGALQEMSVIMRLVHDGKMWLSVGIFSMPNKVWQFDVPCPCSSRRFWWDKNDSLCMKNKENAESPISAMV